MRETPQVRHPVFARIYERVAELAERRGGGEHRRRLLAGLSGRVVEVGAGSGANFAHYPSSVDEVVAVEPEQFWPRVAGGCHLARDTQTAIERAGFQIETCERFRFSPAPLLPADPHILGTARRP